MLTALAAALALVVTDGDTVAIDGRSFRFYGADAPEAAQLCTRAEGYRYHCGAAATLHLDELIAGRPVRCDQAEVPLLDRADAYGRAVAVCYAGDDAASLNERMVRDGYAVAYRHFSTRFVLAEEAARADRRTGTTHRCAPIAREKAGRVVTVSIRALIVLAPSRRALA